MSGTILQLPEIPKDHYWEIWESSSTGVKYISLYYRNSWWKRVFYSPKLIQNQRIMGDYPSPSDIQAAAQKLLDGINFTPEWCEVYTGVYYPPRKNRKTE